MTRHPWSRTAIFVTLLWTVSASWLAAQSPRFDGRGWTVGFHQESTIRVLTEYVLPGQNVDNWRELVTSTVFHQALPLDRFLQELRSQLANGCPSLVWNMIQQDQRTAIYEFHDDGCGGFEATSEIDRVRIEDDRRMYRLGYAVKTKGALPAARRKEWLEIMKQAPLVEGLLSAPPAARPAAPAPNAAAKTPVKSMSTEDLSAGVQKLGWPCPSGTKSEAKGQTQSPMGVLTIYYLECSNGQRFGVLVDPSGGIVTAVPQK